MHKKRLYPYLLAGLLLTAGCSEQNETGQSQNTPAVEKINTAATGGETIDPELGDKVVNMDAAKAAFEEKYPQANSVKWAEDDNGYYEANFEQQGEKYRADFTKEGQWVETERSIKYEELPKAVQSAIKKEYGQEKITEVEQVDNAEKGQFYDVEFKDKGKNMDVEFREDGQILNQ